MFKDHPSKPKILVVPWMREHLHSTCDVPSNIEDLKTRFNEFDFSLFE